MSRAEIDYVIAVAAGRDEGDRSMRAAGRGAWSLKDWRAAARLTRQLLCLSTRRDTAGEREGHPSASAKPHAGGGEASKASAKTRPRSASPRNQKGRNRQ